MLLDCQERNEFGSCFNCENSVSSGDKREYGRGCLTGKERLRRENLTVLDRNFWGLRAFGSNTAAGGQQS